jgi:hypothetical protein
MLNNVIDPVTNQPRKLGELFNDRNIRLVGEMRWDSAVNKVDTRNLRIISTPNDGGAPAITVIPDGSYTLSGSNTSIWIEIRRTAGTTTVVLGTSLIADVSSQQKPRPNWIQLFLRTSTNDIVTLGNWVVLAAPQWTKAGVTRGTSIYDAIVGSATNPFATHTTIQGAIDDALDGDRILVLAGTYNLTGPGNSVISSSAALSWSGKTLTIEGEGYGTIIENAGSMTTAFYIRSTSSSTSGTLGNGSRVLSLQLRNLPQVVVFDGGSGNGVRNCNVEVYSSGFGVSTAPAKSGTGNFGVNTVREMIITTGAISQIRETVIGPDIQTRLFDNSTGNEFLDSTGTRRLAIKTALKVGDVSSIASQALDVIGDIRTTTGLVHTPAVSMNIVDDAGASQNIRAKTLLLSTNISSAATQTLDVVGDIRTTTGILHTPALSMNIVDDAGALQNMKAKSLVLSDSSSDVASMQQLLVQGRGNISTSLQIGGIATISSLARTSNIVTIITSTAHGFYPGATVTVNAVANTSVNGTFTVASIPNATTFTYSQTGTNIVSTSSAGTVRADLNIAQTTEVIGSLSFSSAFTTRAMTSVQANYTVADHDYIVIATGSTTLAVTLPTISSANRGRHILVKSNNSASFIQVAAAALQTIDGSTNPVLLARYEAVSLVSDGTSGWLIV